MKRFRACVLPALVVLGTAGCGGTVDEGPVPFKATDTSQFEEMKNHMISNVKGPGSKKGAAKPAPAPSAKAEN